MKKFKIIYLLIVACMVCMGCHETDTSKNNTEEKLNNDSLTSEVKPEAKPEVKEDFTIYHHHLSMYNESYRMRITPIVDSIYNQYVSNILLTKKGDTIFNKRINIDSLGQIRLKYQLFADSAEHTEIGTYYKLRKVVYHGVRTNYLYFEADITSIEGKKDLTVLFQLSYLGKDEIGKLSVNGIW